MGNGSGQQATVSGPSRAQEEYVRATAWSDIRDTPKEGNERGPVWLKTQQKVDGIHRPIMVERSRAKRGGSRIVKVRNKRASCPPLKCLEMFI